MASSCQTALNYIDYMNRLNDDLKKGFQVITMMQKENHSLADAQKVAGMALELPTVEKGNVSAPIKCGKVSLAFDECQLVPFHPEPHKGSRSEWHGEE